MNKIISPIAIDLGARNTGVYFAHYEAGSSPGEIAKEGKVYQLEKDKFTLLMAKRTAARHQRRGYDRRQMAKRLFKLIWCKHFGLPWDKDVQQTVSFLLNRRGFSFLTEEYDADTLSQFPREAFEELPNELQQATSNDDGSYDYASVLVDWANQSTDKIRIMNEALNLEPRRVRKELLLIAKTEKLHEYCSSRKDGNTIPEEKKANLSQLSTWILEDWVKERIQGLPHPSGNTVDIVKYLNEQEPTTAEKIFQGLPDPQVLKQKKAELKKLEWNFEPEKFNVDEVDFGENGNPNISAHLHHLAFALGKVYNELDSGGRHRSKYFKEIKDVLKNENHTHGYLKIFCRKVQSDGFQGLTVENLSKLIGHISNLELKPLRKYFNDKKHAVSKTNKEGDQWDPDSITRLFHRWIMKEWRVNPQKDKLKAKGGDYDYKVLRKKWTERPGTVIDFWLNTDPNYTVPPYQDNNNRRPPKCQSLLLNVGYLNEKYPQWRSWINDLKEVPSIKRYLKGYTKELAELESGKGKKYFSDTEENTGGPLTNSGRRSMAELDARILQFIFDRVKAEDDLKLNEIYSHAKKIKQNTRDGESTKDASEKLKDALSESRIPKVLKGEVVDGVFPEKSFLHLVCKYYKFRQRARDGRIYIHPEYRDVKGRGYENTGRFDDKEDLLTYCNHKPRQKRYQMIWDLAGLLQVPPQKLEGVAEEHSGETTGDKLVDWLSKIKGLQTNCERAAREQKNRRGRLKMDIQNVFGFTESKVADAKSLHSYCTRAVEFCTALTESLYSDADQAKWAEELKKNPATAVYLLAQINNIAFKERNGNANTCAVCSMDNSHRMQMVATIDGEDTTAKAQRLPAIPTRIIDGAVMRMARIVGGAIAEDKWTKIEAELEAGKKVCVPIITESNRFQFEPDLKTLKGKRIDNRDKAFQESNPLDDKDKRIKLAGESVCPYTGKSVQGGDKDHIIPRSSEWGTLNDEANLIWASDKGNKEIKQDKEFSLKDLNDKYKQAVFEKTDDDQIENWITKEIDNGSSEDFKFGRYRSFINLTTDQQKAFRHALFLPKEHPLRDKVINAIDNKNRTLVNGTQRYFAEVLANNLHKMAKRKGKEKLLSFDYFGVEAWDTRRGDGVKDLRSLYETVDSVIASYAKSEDKKQQVYSHLLDAQLAFVIVADGHRNQGGLRLKIEDDAKKEPRYDRETGELSGLLYTILVPDEGLKLKLLERRKPNENFASHRSFTRDTYYADHYLPILLKEENQSITVRVGFSWGNSAHITTDTEKKEKKMLNTLVEILPLCNGTQHLVGRQYGGLNALFSTMKEIESFSRQLGKNNYFYLAINKFRLHEYWREQYNTKTGKQFDESNFIYKTLCYRTTKEAISKPDDLIKNINEKKKFILPVEEQDITLPVKKQWEECLRVWQEKEASGISFAQFLREHFKSHTKDPHQKVRKVFSLPVLTGQGKLMLQRKSWNGGHTYQIVNDSDSRSPDNKPSTPVRLDDGSLGIKLAQWARSKRIIKLPSKDKYQDGETINPADWYEVDKSQNTFPDGIDKIWYRIDDSTAPSIAVKLAKNGSDLQPEFMEKSICQHGFRKAAARKATKDTPAEPEKSPQDIRNEFFEKEIKPARKGEIKSYKGASYKKEMERAFKTAKKVDKLQ